MSAIDIILLGPFFLVLAWLVLRLSNGRRRVYLPDAFVASQLLLFIGSASLFLVEPSSASNFIFRLASVSFTSTLLWSAFFVSLPENKLSYIRTVPRTPSLTSHRLGLLLVLLANGLVLTVILSNNSVRTLLLAGFTTSEGTLLAARKAITASTEGYMAPGLIKQVRDILAPMAIAGFILASRNKFTDVIFIAAFLLTAVAMIISGQRQPLLFMLAAIGLAFVMKSNAGVGRVKPGALVAFGFGGVLAYGLLSRLLGRTEQDVGFLEGLGETFANLWERIFEIVPREAAKTYEYWSQLGPTGGQSWLGDLSILLPGEAGMTLSNEMHSFGGGSEEGNAPLFFAVDSWFAFGWLGVFLAPALILGAYHVLDAILWRMRSHFNDAVRFVAAMFALSVYSPYLFLLNGGLVLIAVAGLSALSRPALLPSERAYRPDPAREARAASRPINLT